MACKLIFKGVVQGVGFRPTIFRIAQRLGLSGYVVNKGSEVEVVVDRDADRFIEQVRKELPRIAQVTEVVKEPDARVFPDFRILHSKKGEKRSQIPVDVATCEKCRAEMFDPGNRRYLFPFTNCTVCGARYSLIMDVPYDRERTSMDRFPICPDCQREYRDPDDRRYHAQTISCPRCGPVYRLYDRDKRDLGVKDAVSRFAAYLDQGRIGVIKSWGGMHLCCVLEELPRFREWYRRPQKAFAIMVRDLKTAEGFGDVSADERELLRSPMRPIVLLRKKTGELVSPGLDTVGVFLPYTGLHHLLFSFLSADALVMTSANTPGEPMLRTNQEVFSLQAEYYLLHNREIPNRVDDSVVRLWQGNRFFLRKSRGFVPEALPVPYDTRVVSVGAGENICGALSVDKKLFCTQYIGDSKYYGTVEFLEESLRHLMTLSLKDEPVQAVAMDLHPRYESRAVARKFAEEWNAPAVEVQHHWAHAASLLVDRRHERGVILALDGLGYGEDGRFWGGEVLDVSFDTYTRVGHLAYLPLIGGDEATRDPRRLVYALFQRYGKEVFFSGHEAEVLKKLLCRSPLSSSLGRYLDALSCYLGICTTRTYSGEPAMKLERYLSLGSVRYPLSVTITENVVGVADVFRQLDEQLRFPLSEKNKADASYSLVHAVVGALADIAIEHALKEGVGTVGVSGGVSYNVPITEMIQQKVTEAGLVFLVHQRVPNGDGGIAVGQNAIAAHRYLRQ
jgi:hydrogenase maturation protein HypF